MSALRDALRKYLELRRNLGFKLQADEYVLRSFIAFAEREDASYITTDLVLRWIKESPQVKLVTWAGRVCMVRLFATWLSAIDRRTEVPPTGLFPRRCSRQRPYIYSDVEIDRIVGAASRLRSRRGVRGRTFSTIYGLLSVTGMRLSEPLAFDREDVDLQEGILKVQESKFSKSRLVPLHDSTRLALIDYARYRDQVFPRPTTAAFFVSERGWRVTNWATEYNFARISCQIGLRAPARRRFGHGHGPRLHDLRHRFAVCVLLNWYRRGLDVERELPKLSAYLGHAHVNDTYWYLEAVPELLELAAKRLENRREVKP
jgi:integrase/recombinase XerD